MAARLLLGWISGWPAATLAALGGPLCLPFPRYTDAAASVHDRPPLRAGIRSRSSILKKSWCSPFLSLDPFCHSDQNNGDNVTPPSFPQSILLLVRGPFFLPLP